VLTCTGGCVTGSPLLRPLLRRAGQDISHWFDAKSNEPKTTIDTETGCRVPFCPEGVYVDIPAAEPRMRERLTFRTPWWRDEAKFLIGRVTARPRRLRVVNVVSRLEHLLECCSEETLTEILFRYLAHNAHATSYTW
jgi:hypothetical protein